MLRAPFDDYNYCMEPSDIIGIATVLLGPDKKRLDFHTPMSYVPYARFISLPQNVGYRNACIVNTSIEGTHWVVVCADIQPESKRIWILDPLGPNTIYTAEMMKYIKEIANDVVITPIHFSLQAPGTTTCSFYAIFWFCNLIVLLTAGGGGDFEQEWLGLTTMLDAVDLANNEYDDVLLGDLPTQFQDICLGILILLSDDVNVNELELHTLYGQSWDDIVRKLKPLLGVTAPVVAADLVVPSPIATDMDNEPSDVVPSPTGSAVNRRLALEVEDDDDGVDIIDQTGSATPFSPPPQTPARSRRVEQPTRRETSNANRY